MLMQMSPGRFEGFTVSFYSDGASACRFCSWSSVDFETWEPNIVLHSRCASSLPDVRLPQSNKMLSSLVNRTNIKTCRYGFSATTTTTMMTRKDGSDVVEGELFICTALPAISGYLGALGGLPGLSCKLTGARVTLHHLPGTFQTIQIGP